MKNFKFEVKDIDCIKPDVSSTSVEICTVTQQINVWSNNITEE